MTCKNYVEIAECFEKTFNGAEITAAFAGAVKSMKLRTELCARIQCFDDTLWSIIEDFLNSGGAVADEDYFLQALALLECLLSAARAAESEENLYARKGISRY